MLFSYCSIMGILTWLFFMISKTLIVEVDLFMFCSVNFSFSMVLDKISISFSMVVTLISGSVFLFSHKYMEEDPFKDRFIWILMFFVISMNLLIFSGSLFFILLGWDGLGITSFALIIYYQSQESLGAGFQTLMINRLGDVVIVLSMFLLLSSGQFTIFSMSEKMYYLSGVVTMLCVASLTKSAQFPFSSWLPAAMAAPTPVSALVHSSTLVTAGIFLMIRLSYNFSMSDSITSMLLFCGSVTCLLGGWAAIYENDIKKIIALSTLSQLGVMVFSLGLNLPSLALFHLYTHALFKALLFLAAGHILLVTFGNQDIRLLGGVGLLMPLVSVMFNISSLCLIGFPFMSAFYSKHLILEKMLMANVNLMSAFLMMVATMMTAIYVSRTLKVVSSSKIISSVFSSVSSIFTTLPVMILGLGGIMGGKLLLSLEVNNFEYVFISSSESNLINFITFLGVVLGFLGFSMKKSSWGLSTLFFLTPLVYGSMKLLAPVKKGVGTLDYGWLEPYFFIKNKFYFSGSFLSNMSTWPNSRFFLSCFGLMY
uniref:NADH-ubiquinone oxidoreductase chain 5 n=1 Tax=Berthellina sp. TLT-2006 TaxID=407122 RepID=E6Y133_9GAST|nr:NADH dehydrogenase subunit 5 [Berthellina sp. TLT-2006]ABK92219.1 NADH dehydrogenase subunit 5 [Berthellina sp. TLT-2006]